MSAEHHLSRSELATVMPGELQVGDRVCVFDIGHTGTVVAIRGSRLIVSGVSDPVSRRRCYYVPTPDMLVDRVRRLQLARCRFANLTDEETATYMANWEARGYQPLDD